jgi:hypothetical protein
MRTAAPEDRIQNTEIRMPNPERQTPNQPSRALSIIVATSDWPLLADSLEGVRSVGAVETVLIRGQRRPRGDHISRTVLRWFIFR